MSLLPKYEKYNKNKQKSVFLQGRGTRSHEWSKFSLRSDYIMVREDQESIKIYQDVPGISQITFRNFQNNYSL